MSIDVEMRRMDVLKTILLTILLSIPLLSAEVLHFGYDTEQFVRYNKKDTILAISIWLDEIAAGTGYDIDAISYDDVREMVRDLKAKKLDFVTTSALNFVRFFDKDDLADGFSGSDSESGVHDLMLIVKAEASTGSWQWLSEAKVYGLEGSEISKLYFRQCLWENAVEDHVRWIETKNYQQALLKLFFRQGDAAIVTKKAFSLAVEMNPQMKRRLRVFDVSPLSDATPSFFRKGVDQKMVHAITKAAIALPKSVRGEQLLEVFRADSIIKVPVSDLELTEKAYKVYLESMKER